MFDTLKRAFSNAAKSIAQKELSERDIDRTLSDLQLALLESDVAQEVSDDLAANLKKGLLGLKLEKGQTAHDVVNSRLQKSVAEMLYKAGKIDIIQKILDKKHAKKGPFVIAFLGINGTGKTTTVAKVAYMLRKNGISVVLAAGDTHRAGAIEQLSVHGQKIATKVIAQRYGADPSAVARDALDYGRKHYIDCVLIDTAGRMQTAKNLMDEMAKIIRVVKPDLKLFVGDSLAGNDTINQAREFFQYTSFDGAILTKIDADAKGGSALSIIHITSKPIVFLGVGQSYDDIIPFNPDKFLESLFGPSDIRVENLVQSVLEPRLSEPLQDNDARVESRATQVSASSTSSSTSVSAGGQEIPVETDESYPKPYVAPELSEGNKDIESEVSSLKSSDYKTKDLATDESISSTSDYIDISQSEGSGVGASNSDQVSNLAQETPKAEKKRGFFGGLFGKKDKNKEKDNKSKAQNKSLSDKENSNINKENASAKDPKSIQKDGRIDPKSKKASENSDKENKESANKDVESCNSSIPSEKQETKEGKKEVVYLSDEDIEDLFK